MPRRIEFPGYRTRMEEVRKELKTSRTTQQQLANKAGLPGWQISHLLNGGLPEDIEDFRRFAAALEKPIGWFFLDEREIEALIEFHGHGPSRGKAPRRQGRRTAGSLLLALTVGSAHVLGWPTGSAAAQPESLLSARGFGVLVANVAYQTLLGRFFRRLARPLLPTYCPA